MPNEQLNIFDIIQEIRDVGIEWITRCATYIVTNRRQPISNLSDIIEKIRDVGIEWISSCAVCIFILILILIISVMIILKFFFYIQGGS